MNEKLLSLLSQFRGRSIVVLGDLVADLFVYGQAARVSREAPVLIIEHEQDKLALGGAGNTAHNIKALGGDPIVIGFAGNDLYGDMMVQTMRDEGIDVSLVQRTDQRPTTTKERVVASGLHTTYQQLVRIDRGSREPVSGELEKKMLDAIDLAAGKADLMVVSDYGYGVFSEAMIMRLAAIAESEWCRVMVDSRFRMMEFKGAYMFTPNEPEAGAACHLDIRHDEDVALAAERLLMGADAHAVAVTRGKKGMYIKESGKPGEFIPIYGTDQIADVTGAGDTVMATFALSGTAEEFDLSTAARLATVAAGLVVLKHGTAVVTPEEIRAALERNPWRE